MSSDPKTRAECVRDVLAQIDTVLAAGDEAAYALWAVLTALRGPDSESITAKATVTVPIRRRALPRTAASANNGYSVAKFAPFAPFAALAGSDYNHHFLTHAENAWQALANLGVPEERKPFQRPVKDDGVALFMIDNQPERYLLDSLLSANPDMAEELADLADLSVGTETTVGGGAGAEFTIRRVQ